MREAAREHTTISGSSATPRTSCESSGRLASESNTTRRGWRATPSIRAVRRGSSISAVPIPTATASDSARQRCARARLASPEIHCESPVRVATLPSSVMADLKITSGRPVRACLRKGWFSMRAASPMWPSTKSTRTPSSRRMPGPRPAAFGVGSSEAITTRAMPAETIASVHGGVRPWWQHGSSETYMVAPAVRPAAASSAITSAWLSPGGCVMPSPITRPSLTTHRADHGVRAGLPARAPGELDRPHQMLRIAFRRGVADHPKTPYQRAVFRAGRVGDN